MGRHLNAYGLFEYLLFQGVFIISVKLYYICLILKK